MEQPTDSLIVSSHLLTVQSYPPKKHPTNLKAVRRLLTVQNYPITLAARKENLIDFPWVWFVA